MMKNLHIMMLCFGIMGLSYQAVALQDLESSLTRAASCCPGSNKSQPASCQTLCNTSVALHNLILENNIQNYTIYAACCLCFVIGNKGPYDAVEHLWYMNGCGVLEEIASVAQGTITVTGVSACNICFIKATLKDHNNQSVTQVWYLEPNGYLKLLLWPETASIVDVDIESITECNLCFVKVTAVKSDNSLSTVVWYAPSNGSLYGSLVELVSCRMAAVTADIIGIQACGLCFIRVISTDNAYGNIVQLWRVESDGSLTVLIEPSMNVVALAACDVISLRECGLCFVKATATLNTQAKFVLLWRVESDGSLTKIIGCEELVAVVDVVGLQACDQCFIKATLTYTCGKAIVELWQVDSNGCLKRLIGPGMGICSLADLDFVSVRECGLCFVKATAYTQDQQKFVVLWRVESNGSLTQLFGLDTAAATADIVGVRACNICLVKAVLTDSSNRSSVLLWRVESDGSLTKLIGPGTGLSAVQAEIIGARECNTCFIKAEICPDGYSPSSVLWRVERNGSLTEKRFFHRQR